MAACERCGTEVVSRTPDRCRVLAVDFAESSGTFIDGQLCPGCFSRLLDFLGGHGKVVPA